MTKIKLLWTTGISFNYNINRFIYVILITLHHDTTRLTEISSNQMLTYFRQSGWTFLCELSFSSLSWWHLLRPI